MRPLIDERLYERLMECRDGMIRAEIGSPANIFVPVGAPDRGAPPIMPNVLYVGKATRGYGGPDLEGFLNAVSMASTVIDEWFMPGGSAFWQFIRAILTQVATGCDVPGEALRDHLAWSNLAKIGELDGNPDRWSLNEQKDLCRESLLAEISAFKPTAIVVATTNYADKEIAFPVFGHEDWSFDTPEQDRVAYKRHPDHGLVVWTNHPQGMKPAGTRASVQAFVADLILRQWQGRELPPSKSTAPMRTGPTNDA